jgi:hypothetical protein
LHPYLQGLAGLTPGSGWGALAFSGGRRLLPIPDDVASGVGGSTTDAASFNTASLTLVAGQPCYVAVSSHNATAADQPTVTGAGLTWTAEKSVTLSSGARRMTVFSGSGATSAGALTIDFAGVNQTAINWIVIQFTAAASSGYTVQVPNGTTTASGTSLAGPTLAAFEHASNVHLAFFMTSLNAGITPDGNFTELADTSQTGNNVSLECQWARNVLTCTSTFTTAAAACISLEVKAGLG